VISAAKQAAGKASAAARMAKYGTSNPRALAEQGEHNPERTGERAGEHNPRPEANPEAGFAASPEPAQLRAGDRIACYRGNGILLAVEGDNVFIALLDHGRGHYWLPASAMAFVSRG
jgi:hypothetical protein